MQTVHCNSVSKAGSKTAEWHYASRTHSLCMLRASGIMRTGQPRVKWSAAHALNGRGDHTALTLWNALRGGMGRQIIHYARLTS